MASISFEYSEDNLILCYAPAMGIGDIKKRLDADEVIPIKRTFFVTKDLLFEPEKAEDDWEETLRFCVGIVGDTYTTLDSKALNTNHSFFFGNEIKLRSDMFIAYRNISILKKIDRIIQQDFYIGGKWEENGGVSLDAFLELIHIFPKTAELNRYADSRISVILKEFFPQCDKYEEIYDKFIDKRNPLMLKQRGSNYTKVNLQIELAQFSEALADLEEMLADSVGFPESAWQVRIQNILQLLYPKYILCVPELSFKGLDKHDKRPDFVLVDTNGFVDILEIKKPEVQVLTKQASYRDNYVPVREFAGAIQQIQKYIFCLTSSSQSREDVLDKLKKLLPNGIVPEIINPQGILLLGRSEDFNVQQRNDFELIKRQYKNVADIMTYDDLLKRLHSIKESLQARIK